MAGGRGHGRWRRGWPRWTVRLRLTLLYGGLFLVCGAGLLALTYLLVVNRFPLVVHRAPGPFGALPSPGALDAVRNQAGQQRNAALHELLMQSLVALGVMTVMSVALGWLVAGRVLRPLRTITAAARRLSASSLHERLALAGPADELKELGDTFDGLLARLEGAFEAQRQFVANASHELRTPLARQRTLIEVALADPEPSTESLRAVCGRVLVAGEQQERLIDALLTLAGSQRGLQERGLVDVAGVVSEVVESRRDDAQRRGVRMELNAGQAWALGDGRLVERLVANLVGNAVRHNVTGGWVEVGVGRQGGCALLSVANSGPVIPAGQVGRLFEPFQRLAPERTGRHGGGTGLGLSIVNAIVAVHSAQIRARPLPAGGLEVQVRFPLPPGLHRP